MVRRALFMTRLCPALTLTVVLTATPWAHAQPAVLPLDVLTLSEAIRHALGHAPAIHGAEAAVAAAEAGVLGAQQLPNPTLSVEVENVMGSGPYSRFGASETTYSLSMPLEVSGRRAAQTRAALAEQAYARVGFDAAKSAAALKVTQAFIALAAGERRLVAARSRRSLAEQAERAARARLRAGKVSPIDEQRAAAQRISATVVAERAERAVELARNSLARLTGVQQAFLIAAPWFDNTTIASGLDADGAPLAVAAAQAQLDAARARAEAARRARIPDLSVSAGTRRFKDSGDSAAVFAVSVPLPIFNRGGADLSRARAELAQAAAGRSAAALEADEALAAARADLIDAQAAAASANGPELAAAQEAARIARIGYAEGKFSQLELIEAERQLFQTQDAAIDALAALHNAHARLAHILGRIAPIYKD